MHRTACCIILGMTIFIQSCSDESPVAPKFEPPIPITLNDAELLAHLDPTNEDLKDVFAALETGDSLAAIDALLAHYLATEPMEAPHIRYSEPIQMADKIMKGWITLYPHPPTQLPDDPTWTEDPFRDDNWRFQYHSFRWAMALLYAFEETRDPNYFARFIFLMEDYGSDNLGLYPASDMTWYDMAAALRVENWLYSWRYLVMNGYVKCDLMVKLLLWIWTHGDMLAGKIPYSSENNHGIFHNRALTAISLILPEFRDSDAWLELGLRRLDLQVLNLVSEEGVYLEPSPFYHFYAYRAFQDARDFLNSADMDLNEDMARRVGKMPLFAALILQPSGMLPMLSDCDQLGSVDDYLNRDPWLDYSISQGKVGSKPTLRCISYLTSGYVIFRSGWGDDRAFIDETHAVFDTGPKDGWHGHYDGMTFTLSAYSKNLIVDSGYYTFEGAWRDYFVSPEAHNVLVPASGASKFRKDPSQMVWRENESSFFQSASMPFEQRGEGVWVRHFVYLEPNDFLIIDHVNHTMVGSVDQLFHLIPGALVDTLNGNIRINAEEARLDLFQAKHCSLTVLEGESSPMQGWYSPVYGTKVSNPVARFRTSDLDPTFYTLLHVHKGDDDLLSFTFLEGTLEESLVFNIERRSGPEQVEIWPGNGQVERRFVPPRNSILPIN